MVTFACPECRETLDTDLRCANGHSFSRDRGVYNLLSSGVNQLAIDDATYHASQKDTWLELNQVATYRNLHYHEAVLRAISKSESSRTLEIAGGVGFDLEIFLCQQPKFGLYVFSEISPDLAAHVAAKHASDRVVCCAIDAHRLPFPDAYFDAVYMIAALHHMENMEAVIAEVSRVLKPGGTFCCGIEPNVFWSSLIDHTKGIWRRLLPSRAHSPADEEAHGVTIRSLRHLANGLTVKHIEPVWLFCGFLHYGLEFVFRLLRLKRRIVLPVSIEKILVSMDRALLTLPWLNRISWHYTAVYEKPHATPAMMSST